MGKLLEMLAEELGNKSYGGGGAVVQGFKAGLTPATPSLPYMHGPGGLFGIAGLERDVISTRVQPQGLASALPSRGTVVTNPMFPYLTSYAAAIGANPNGVCDDGPEAGPAATCIQTAQFGRYMYETRTMEIYRQGQQINRGEFLDLTIYNGPNLDGSGNGITQPDVNGNPSLTSEVLQRMMEVGIAFQNKLVPQLYQGNPANNTAGGGYAEFPGLDILIGTNKVDALTGTACPSLASDIKNFNYAKVDSGTGPGNIVNVVSYLLRYLRYNAEHMNLAPVQWIIAMRPELWWELSAVWPCAYMTYRCQNNAGTDQNAALFMDSSDMLAMRDEMRNNMYLIADGIKYPVVTDTGIFENTNTNNNKVSNSCFASDIYVVPVVVRGGLVSTYWEYLDFQKTAMDAIADGSGAGGYSNFWTDGGRYLWTRKPPTNWCVKWAAMIQPRVILRTPQLAGRITNIQYCPLQHVRTPQNAAGNDPYALGGGVGARPAPSLYAEWKS